MFVALDSETRGRDSSVEKNYLKSLTTDQELFSYNGEDGEPADYLLVISDLGTFAERIRFDMGMCKYIEGAAWDGVTIVAAMRQAPSLRLRDRMELVNGHQTYVLEAQGMEDAYVMWIDPEHGFNPRRIEMIRYHDGKRDPSDTKSRLLVDNINIENIDGKYIIMSADFEYKREPFEGEVGTMEVDFSLRRTNVNFNPDFSKAIKEFWEGVPEGVPISCIDERRMRGVQYEWVNGQVLAKVEPALIGELLPSLGEFNLTYDLEAFKGKRLLTCFWDFNQRPSRHLLGQLAKQADSLKEQEVVVIAIQTSKVNKEKLDEWIKEQKTSFLLGSLPGKEKAVFGQWSVRGLPWLIITDKDHKVTHEGFTIDELGVLLK